MKRNPWLLVLPGLLWLGACYCSFGSPNAPVVYPTSYPLVNGTGAVLVQPETSLIPTTHGSLIHESDAVFIPTTVPLLNPLKNPLVPKGIAGPQ